MPDQELALDDSRVEAADLKDCLRNLRAFTERYAPLFVRSEQREHAHTYIEGRLSSLQRKTIEPIATAHLQRREPLQRFVGAGAFDDDLLLAELRRHVVEEIGDPAGVLILDPTCFEKKGDDSVGVARQWNGRLGKEDNCQKAVMLDYASPRGSALLDRALYMPEHRVKDREHREKCHVPREVKFRTSWQLALQLLDRAETVPHAWVVGDDELGRPAAFRAGLRRRGERYALDVPSNTLVAPVHQPRLPKKRKRGRPRKHPSSFRARDLARLRTGGAWVRILVRDGSKGPHYVLATSVDVLTRIDRKFGPRERLVIIKTIGPNPRHWYVLTNAGPEIPIGSIVGAWATRHSIEHDFERAKGDVGLAHYEVRSWVGWHHHVTLTLLALWFLMLERKRIKKNAGTDGRADGTRAPLPSSESALRSRRACEDPIGAAQ